MQYWRYRLIGGPGSPYSLKIRALMRYRRIPFDWVLRNRVGDEVAHVRPPTIPILHDPQDNTYQADSTPLVDYLERHHPDQRSVIPSDPAVAFINYLLEDMSDEWATKFMFAQRWADTADQDFYGHYLGWFREAPALASKVAATGTAFRDRQVGRNDMVGVSEENRPVIDRTFTTLMQALAQQLESRMFLFGNRPASADFAFYGQLQPGTHAPGASVRMRELAPSVFHWTILLDDLSGWPDGQWDDCIADPGEAILALLRLCGEAYLPYLQANAAALAAGDDELHLSIWGHDYRQRPFRYQAKCFAELRSRYEALSETDKKRLFHLLEQTGCANFLFDSR